MHRIAVAALAVAMLAACSPPQPPEEERRPEPQARTADGAGPTRAAVAATDGNRVAAAAGNPATP